MRTLEITEYEPDGWTNHTSVVADPSWEQIEAAVRRLDTSRRPFVKLFLDSAVPDDDYVTIMGGAGTYWVAVTTGSHDQRRLFDPEKSSAEVAFWTSDQGFADHAFHGCDLATALRAARHFVDHADCDPGLQWETAD
jgi:hypothetical protein